jgi:phage shock protein A
MTKQTILGRVKQLAKANINALLDSAEDLKSAKEWGDKALAASRRADALREAGDTAEADRFDNLAKVALERQLAAERQTAAAAPTIKGQQEVVE